jgi:hypothetical protein
MQGKTGFANIVEANASDGELDLLLIGRGSRYKMLENFMS